MLTWLKKAFESLFSLIADSFATFLVWISTFVGKIADWIWNRLLLFLSGVWAFIVGILHSFISGVDYYQAQEYMDRLFQFSPEVLGFAEAMGLRVILQLLLTMTSLYVLVFGFKMSVGFVRVLRGGG